MAVRYGPSLLTLRKESRHLRLSTWGALLCISYLKYKTNNWVWSKINFLVGLQEPFLAIVKRLKLTWFGHVTHHDTLSITILQGTLEGGWCCGWQRKYWMDNIKKWTSLPMPELFTRASHRNDWNRISAESSLMCSLMTRSVKGLIWIHTITSHQGQ